MITMTGRSSLKREIVEAGPQNIEGYRSSAGEGAVEVARVLAAPLRGARVLHVNATPYGGGVAEILRSAIPLFRDLGLVADWKLITGDEQFFSVTKTIHNGLQGADRTLTTAEQATYLEYFGPQCRAARGGLRRRRRPRPAAPSPPRAARRGVGPLGLALPHRHSEPNPAVWSFVRPFLAAYDAAVFTLGGFVPPDLPVARVEIIPPAIDPESPKNLKLDAGLARRVLQWIGVEVDRPLVAQISRFDPWKDPLGVIAAYRRVKEEVPGLQLALAGSMARDDPEGWEIYRQMGDASAADPDIHVFTNLAGVGNIEVNATPHAHGRRWSYLPERCAPSFGESDDLSRKGCPYPRRGRRVLALVWVGVTAPESRPFEVRVSPC
jgi:trehalose synthase